MLSFLARYRLLILTLLLGLAALQMISVMGHKVLVSRYMGKAIDYAVSPVESAWTSGVNYLQDSWRHYLYLSSVAKQRDHLLDQLKSLDGLKAELDEVRQENLRLRRLLHYSEQTEGRALAARIIGRSSTGWSHTVRIDRGREHGLSVGLAVLDGHYLVGQVRQVGARSSIVLLLTDSTSSVDVLVQRSRARALASGTSGALLKLEFLERREDVRPGDRVISTGLDGVYPKGVPVGVVKTVSSSAGSLFSFVAARPSAALGELEEVLVVLDRSSSEADLDASQEIRQ